MQQRARWVRESWVKSKTYGWEEEVSVLGHQVHVHIGRLARRALIQAQRAEAYATRLSRSRGHRAVVSETSRRPSIRPPYTHGTCLSCASQAWDLFIMCTNSVYVHGSPPPRDYTSVGEVDM